MAQFPRAGRLPAGSRLTFITSQKMPLHGQTSSLTRSLIPGKIIQKPGGASCSGTRSSSDLQQHLLHEDSGRCGRHIGADVPRGGRSRPLSKWLGPHTHDPHPSAAGGPPANSGLHPPPGAALPPRPDCCRVRPLPALTATSSKRVFGQLLVLYRSGLERSQCRWY